MNNEYQDYIGDGVYVSFDGYQICVAVNDPENVVAYFEPQVFAALVRYADRVWGEK